ncbi:AbrB/MazE/SpoVT family DNA-binding domain-containing protein [Nocardia sp. NPDC088792]|uniref:AbrB/MazE/SpoVT family DNA-binding domain-containing protein n=1 Tax=Nocardia sp. NPDC088792 TaxID=3364332 RepID=UPI00382D5404
MDAIARLTSKGQLTVPKAILDALELHIGDNVLSRVEGRSVVLARPPDLLELAGSVPVPSQVRGQSWEEIRDAAWASRWREGEA